MSPWRRSLTIPPDSSSAWVRLAVWELGMGTLLYGALSLGTRLIVTAPDSIVTVFDVTKCYAVPRVVAPCERVAYWTGGLNAALNLWCGVLLMAVAIWLLWELWNAVAPQPITDDFLQLLDQSFGRDWRSPRTWPWARMVYAYGFTLVGVTVTGCIGLLISAAISSRTPVKAPIVRVETSQSFRLARSYVTSRSAGAVRPLAWALVCNCC
jgi:hypothetical protein